MNGRTGGIRDGRRWARTAVAALAALVLVVALAVVVGGDVAGLRVRFVLILAAIVATVIGVARNRPARVRPWVLLLVGMVASAGGDLAVLLAARGGPLTANVPLDAWLTAAAGVCFLAGLLDATRPLGRGDVGSGLDALIVTLASGSVIWQVIVVPAAAPGWAGSGTELAGALQISILLAVLVLLARVVLTLAPGQRTAGVLLTIGVLAAVLAFVLGALHDAAGGDAYSGVRAGLGAAANLAAAAAVLHPSMRVLTDRRGAVADRVSLHRTLALGLALTTPPGLLLLASLRGTAAALVSLSVTWMALAAAVMARVHLLQRGRDLARDELARSEERLTSLVANTGDTVLLVATPPGGEPHVRFATPACERLTGRSPVEICQRPLDAIAEIDDAHALRRLVVSDAPLPRIDDLRVRHRDGSHRWVEAVVDVAPQEEERSVVVTLRDVDERKRAELVLAEVALRDELTGLWNRRGLHALLAAALATPDDGLSTAVILADLDGFKAVNDAAGHAAGDAVLRALARRLEGVVREGDAVGRLGGDEFLVVCSVDSRATVAAIAERVVAAGTAPIDVDGVGHRVGVSVGVALAAADTDAARLLARADRALYEAKGHGKGQVRFAGGLDTV